MSSSTPFRLTALLLGLAICAARPAAAHVAPLSDRQMVHASAHVVVAVVESQRARWNEPHNLIVTDYDLRIEDRLKGEAPNRLTISIPGGTLDGITHHTCLTTPLAAGGRYLLFLGDTDRPAFTPLTGAWQGVFREGDVMMPFASVVEAVREMIVELDPLPHIPLPKAPTRHLSSKTYDPAATPSTGVRQPLMAPSPAWTELEPEPVAHGKASLVRPGQTSEKFLSFGHANGPIVFNQLTPDSPFAAQDEAMMGYWNLYAGDFFRVLETPSNTWALGNGAFDIAGFLTDADMNRVFRQPWGEGVLAVTVSRMTGPLIQEADVLFNAAYGWTLDEAQATDPRSGVVGFHHGALHELGHTWGLDHPWQHQDVWWDSVMNYAPKAFRNSRLHADDVRGLRDQYDSVAIHDGLLSAWITSDLADDNNPVYTAIRPAVGTLRAGGNLGLNGPITLENLGTDNIANPTVEVYLTPTRGSLTGSVRLKSVRFRLNARSGDIWQLRFSTLKVPRTVRPGTYSVAFVLKDPRDRFAANNVAWSIYDATVTVTR
ncbi:MAG TPA: matrixin family metalloprotease [Thermoanaerobaculia bacterium]|nr:matrixin family metalloprotease [Thermoanaerobaculia bacterium]